MALSLALNNNWDIHTDKNGNIAVVKDAYAIAQNCANAVRLFTNDAYFNRDRGIPHFDIELGKKALLGEIGKRNPDPTIANLEKEIMDEINASGIGPMGLGGKTTTLDVKILKAHTHTAGLPVGVCIQCWANRHATTKIYD